MSNAARSRTELSCIAVAVFGVGIARPLFPGEIQIGTLFAALGLALLGQGFIRDLFTLRRLARTPAGERPPAEERACICLESAAGLPVILAGLALTVAGIDRSIPLPPRLPPALAAAVWSLGWAVRDLVVEWSPLRIARVKNHGSILVNWRAGRR